MSAKQSITIRIQSADGIKRIEISSNSSIHQLYQQIQNVFKIQDFALYRERNYTKEFPPTSNQTLMASNLKHGDIVYMKSFTAAGSSSSSSSLSSLATTSNRTLSSRYNNSLDDNTTNSMAIPSLKSISTTITKSLDGKVTENDVDIQLSKMDGTIKRLPDPKLCRHNSNGRCVHCSPIEPWDENYLKEQKIKHMSFHAYIRKLTSGVDRGKFVALEDLNCRIKSGCSDHPPWPKGICSKCQPSAITLNRQLYRHVDNVMFENTALVERFLNYWRTTGYQRMGFLYGTYEINSDVPLGIRAHVAAIYEPPQDGTRDSIKLLPDDMADDVNELAAALGLTKIGWIFTDLISEDAAAGTVKHIRGIQTHFLTAHECIFAGQLQNQHPNICKYSSNGCFGSKFVTVCVTGDDKKQIHMEGYAVSAQCMALVRDNCLVPTKDAPELGYIRESTDKQFVPDVYYKEIDQYRNEVSRLARPLPVEYLLVDVPASTPLTPMYTFTVDTNRSPFPIENRYIDGHLQDFNALCTYLSRWQSNEFLDAVSDFHLLLFLSRMEMLPMKSSMLPLLNAIRTKDINLAIQWKSQEIWSTLETLISASSGSIGGDIGMSGIGGGGGAGGSNSSGLMENWTCDHCTFINKGELNACEMCGLPRA